MTNSTQEILVHKIGGQTLIERISGALEFLTGGLSEVGMMPIRQYLDRQIKKLMEVLLEEMRAGQIDTEAVINEDHLVAFVLRVGRAAMEGAAKKKLRIMARYFFRNASLSDYSPDAASEFIDITAQLTDTDMQCLAVLKRAREAGHFERQLEPENEKHRYSIHSLQSEGSDEDRDKFDQAVFALSRFGLIYSGSMMMNSGLNVALRGIDYIDSLDLECLEIPDATACEPTA